MSDTAIDYPRGLTFEKVWAMFQETDKKFQETDRQFKETKQIIKENARAVKELSVQMGGLHNRFGELAEHMVAPGIVEKFNEIGYHFDSVSKKGMEIHGKDGKIKAEIDIILENGETLIAVEVKTNVNSKDIEHCEKKLEILREYMRNDTRKILGAIAGAVFKNEEKLSASEAGFYVLEQTGDTMKLDTPEGFVPREW